jgi:anaerobic ribonucleoside-triphosphate reductase
MQFIYAARAYQITMSSPGSGEPEDWGEDRHAQLQRQRAAIRGRLDTLKKEWDALDAKKAEMRATRDRERDPEIDPDYDLMVERGIAKVTGKQELLAAQREELTRQLTALAREETRMKALMAHESYQDWLDLKHQRDQVMREVARLEAEMKQLMDRMLIEVMSSSE